MKKLDALTSLRFFAAVTIVAEHSHAAFKSLSWFGNLPFDYGVSFFFVLSGFILAFVYREFDSLGSLRDFYAARIARIWPLHLVTLLLFLAIIPSGSWFVGGHGADAVKVTLANVFLLQSWIPWSRYFFSFNAVSWSISTEMLFYLMFPLLRHRWSETWHWKSMTVAIMIGGILTIATSRGVPGIDSTGPYAASSDGIAYIWPFVRIGEFVLGMLAGSIFVATQRRGGQSVILWTTMEIAALASIWLLRNITFGLEGRIAGHPLGLTAWTVYFAHSGAAAGFALVALVMAFGRGAISRALSIKPLVLLGEASFALYLVHQILITFYYLNLPHFAGIPDLALCVSYWALSIGAAFALWAFIEKPARDWIRHLLSRERKTEAATAMQ